MSIPRPLKRLIRLQLIHDTEEHLLLLDLRAGSGNRRWHALELNHLAQRRAFRRGYELHLVVGLCAYLERGG